MDGKAQQVRDRRVGSVRIDEEGGPVGGQRGRDADSEGRAPGRTGCPPEGQPAAPRGGRGRRRGRGRGRGRATPRAMRRERS